MAKPKVMVADDDGSMVALLEVTLGGDPRYELLTARDGAQALEMARLHHPRLLFLDVMMPGMNGFEVCHALKTDPNTAGTKVVMLTALSQDGDLARGKAAGADDYFTKPFSPRQLFRKVEEVLGGGRQGVRPAGEHERRS